MIPVLRCADKVFLADSLLTVGSQGNPNMLGFPGGQMPYMVPVYSSNMNYPQGFGALPVSGPLSFAPAQYMSGSPGQPSHMMGPNGPSNLQGQVPPPPMPMQPQPGGPPPRPQQGQTPLPPNLGGGGGGGVLLGPNSGATARPAALTIQAPRTKVPLQIKDKSGKVVVLSASQPKATAAAPAAASGSGPASADVGKHLSPY